jgi:hypothetical protein
LSEKNPGGKSHDCSKELQGNQKADKLAELIVSYKGLMKEKIALEEQVKELTQENLSLRPLELPMNL